ncbi:alpha/beta hydrolase-fold protein [Mycobacterium sp. MS1601]|uniref:alpha/beta hydrolase-fold protein n=1 Tax=Mycobacterium sp. MS1601 TaxID=1936029 RepID=UPI001EEE5342|nr:alpha/beta hydrolase-fold protein [Mycobacterium sp. MS1601]
MPISLLHGVVPFVTQAVAAATLVAAVGWRTRRWRRVFVPLSVLAGAALTLWLYWYIADEGWGGTPPPGGLWAWVGLTGVAIGVLVLGWRSARGWRRAASVSAVLLCVVSAALSVNLWVGYVPDVQAGWNQLTAGPLPDQIDATGVSALVANTREQHRLPAKGSVVEVSIPGDASHFAHRDEFVYLPPAWFATSPPPQLPTVVMIGGEFNTPADWMRAGNAITTLDTFAAAHHGNAPVVLFVDAVGTFHNDTECVNGPRGNAADHITKDVVPYVVSHFGVSPDRTGWAVAGWSMGGTCAVDLATMHPDQFSVFEDIAGDLAPNAGTPEQTLARLYGGDSAAQASFDPTTVMTRHGPYTSEAGLFVSPLAQFGQATQAQAAQALSTVARTENITCSVVTMPGNHDWTFATAAFSQTLPWLADAVHTPSGAGTLAS